MKNDIVQDALSSDQVLSELGPSCTHIQMTSTRVDNNRILEEWHAIDLGSNLLQNSGALVYANKGKWCMVAEMAEKKNLMLYICLAPSRTIMPVAIEALGVIGSITFAFMKDLNTTMWQF